MSNSNYCITITHSCLQSAQNDAELPVLQQPALVLPAAGKKKVPQSAATAAAAGAEDDLERCALDFFSYLISLLTLCFAGSRQKCCRAVIPSAHSASVVVDVTPVAPI
jgi:hypothetical protein